MEQQIQEYLTFKNATIVHSKTKKQLQFINSKYLIVNARSGKIDKIITDENHQDLSQILKRSKIIEVKASQMIIPGFIDTHFHAPQYQFLGTGFDLQLLEWLNKYTFPCEANFKNIEYARKIYQKCVKGSLKNGTTTICYYGTIHLQACKILSDICHEKGIRGYVGKVCMDQNSPKFYIQECEKSIRQTQQFINYLKQRKYPNVFPLITPRFAPTCSPRLMQELGKLSDFYQVPIQTHLSEIKSEIAWVRQLFPQCNSYTQVYERYQILKPTTIFAHCVHLSDQQVKKIHSQGSGISHCPNSNINVAFGIMPARKLLNQGIKVGLGTDVAGGSSVSMLNAICKTIQVSKLYNSIVDETSLPLTFPQAFYLGTVGGAQILHIENQVGRLNEGMQFDASIVDYSQLQGWISQENKDKKWYLETFQKMIYLMDDRNFKKVYVSGRQVI